jgi:uncharacterized membrane protein YdjX (TVP38/TMEM64 family)
LILAVIFAWRFTPLSALAHPDNIRQWLLDMAEIPGAPLIVLATFILGGLVVFPVMLLIAATAAAFGPWLGFALAGIGAIASAMVTYGIGAAIGREAVETVMGPRLHRVRRSIAERGVLAVAAIRLVPIAPFTLVNLVRPTQTGGHHGPSIAPKSMFYGCANRLGSHGRGRVGRASSL